MPTTRKLCLALLILALVTCGGNLTRISVSQTATANIGGASLLELLTGDAVGFAGLGGFDISQSQEFKNQGIKREQINSVKLKSLTLTITAPASGQDFTFLDSLTFFVEAQGQPKKEIATGGPFTMGARTVTLMVADLELVAYATAPSMTFTTTAKGRKPTNNTTIEAKVMLDADINLGGVVCGGSK